MDRFEVHVSELVEREIRDAHPDLAEKMLGLVAGFKSLAVTPQARDLAHRYIEAEIFRARNESDALHLAVATLAAANYPVSWDFRHLVRVKTRRMASLVNLQQGHPTVEIVAPSEL